MHSMTPDQAQRSRRATLQAAVDTGAACTTRTPDVFFRADAEQQITWQARRFAAVRVCAGCPVRPACEELALRDGEGRADKDDMVRAGLTGPELAAARDLQADRLKAAVDADRDIAGQRLDELTVQLRRTAVVDPDKAGGHRGARALAARNEQIRHLADEIRGIRAARRARAGWGSAA